MIINADDVWFITRFRDLVPRTHGRAVVRCVYLSLAAEHAYWPHFTHLVVLLADLGQRLLELVDAKRGLLSLLFQETLPFVRTKIFTKQD